MYELRSDTFTKPSEAMRVAMAHAEVGDDVYFEDPTINRLEAIAAGITGKEKALFVTSGSMGNLIPLYLNGGRAAEVLAHAHSHIIHHEVGSAAAIAGVIPIGIDTPRGLLDVACLKEHVKPIAYDLARTAMIEVENTIGGICYPIDTLKEIKAFAELHEMKVHMDGARLFNASVATNVDVKTIASCADTVSFCLSKGLGAPVGSMLCGTEEFIDKARKIRKMLGGGMRQSGILAAAGIYALEHNIQRLAEDHRNAKAIATALSGTTWARIELDDVETNMVFFSVPDIRFETVVQVFKNHQILCGGDGSTIRLVTHLDFSQSDTERVCAIIRTIKAQEFVA